MPKKTRKEKILAAYRKRLSVSEQPLKIEPSNEEKQITNYFFFDLKKSLILIAIVITLEISLYFATINHYLKF